MLKSDFVIVGGGIVGLSTAISIKEKYPKLIVKVFEQGFLPSGASTKNAGFACFGSLSEILADVEQTSVDEAVSLIEKRWKGLQLLRQRLGDDNIEYKAWGGYELMVDETAACFQKLDEVNRWLFPLFNSRVFSTKKEGITQFGFSVEKVNELVFNPLEGQLNPAKMMKSLLALALERGVEYYSGSKVMKFLEQDSEVNIQVQAQNQRYDVTCAKLIVCTNGFARSFFPELDLQPGRGQVLITSPIPDLKFHGCFHIREGYYYFRNHGTRVLLGGARHLDKTTETSTILAANDLILSDLKNQLRSVILADTPASNYQIEHQWSGIMAFGHQKNPICDRISDRVVMGVRLGGMGVAIGSLVGEELAAMV